jgi:hypothetical protein
MLFSARISGDPALAAILAASPLPQALLVNADPNPDSALIISRCERFADEIGTGLIITLLPAAPPGLQHFRVHQAVATLWAFTRQAALEWAPRGIRVNAIGLGAAPFGPNEADDQSGRNAANVLAAPATLDDIAATVHAIAAFASMTGQIIRLGA